jgi:hypothetical protein
MAVKKAGTVECKGQEYQMATVELAGFLVGWVVTKGDGSFYEVCRLEGGEMACSCPAFRYTRKDEQGRRTCKHCDGLREKLGIVREEPVPF